MDNRRDILNKLANGEVVKTANGDEYIILSSVDSNQKTKGTKVRAEEYVIKVSDFLAGTKDDNNNQTLEIGGEGDELTLKNGSFNGASVPDSVIPMEQIAQGFKLEDVSDVDPYSGNADKFLKVNASGNDVEWVDAPSALPYTVYRGLLSQAGTNNPTITELENTLGGTITLTRLAQGVYNVAFTGGPLTLGQTTVTFGNVFNSTANGVQVLIEKGSLTTGGFDVVTYSTASGLLLTDSILGGTYIEITVYT